MRTSKLRKPGLIIAMAAALIVSAALPALAGQITQKKEILMGPYFQTLNSGDSVEEAMIGCA